MHSGTQYGEGTVDAGARRRRLGTKPCGHGCERHVTVKAEQYGLPLPARQLTQCASDDTAALTRQELRLGILDSNRHVHLWCQFGAPLLYTPTVDDLVTCDALEPRSWAIDYRASLEGSKRQILREIIRGVAGSTSAQARRDCPRL